MVVAGQQVGLFGGPLYTLYKALTAVTVARQVESQWQVPCLPLFWMDSEDTDFAEIDHLSLWRFSATPRLKVMELIFLRLTKSHQRSEMSSLLSSRP
jgi:uncharacterized protein YllA (UPF0747 family)